MNNGEINRKFLTAQTRAVINTILDNIAKNYGITRAQAFDEVIDNEAESLLDYVTGPERATTALFMKQFKFANGIA